MVRVIQSIVLGGVLLELGLSCSRVPFIQPHSVEQPSGESVNMSTETEIIVRGIELQAREEKQPPKGVEPRSDRDTGFATVFLRFDNPQHQTVSLTVRRIEIRNAVTGRVELLSQPVQDIVLGPLENGEFAFYLTNRTGYGWGDRAKAVVTYQVGNQITTVESDPTEISR